jgi:aspartate racemase
MSAVRGDGQGAGIRLNAPQPVGILGGMGPAAGLDFARQFLLACEHYLHASHTPVADQAFPEHWLAQVPVVDRSRALLDPNAPQPYKEMERAIAQLANAGARTIAIACNTAHAWHDELQSGQPDIELLHIGRETVTHLHQTGVDAAILLATRGTYRIALYQSAFAERGMRCIVPLPVEQQGLMDGIYKGVKAGCLDVARERFAAVGRALHERYGAVPVVMACTEIPLVLPTLAEAAEWTLVDPTRVLAGVLARRAYRSDRVM